MPNGLIPNWESIDPQVTVDPIPVIPSFPEFELPEFPIYPDKPISPPRDQLLPDQAGVSTILFEQYGPDDNGVISATISEGGAGYDSLNPPAVSFSSGTALATAVVENGVVTSIIINSPGSYTDVETQLLTITIEPPPAERTATAEITDFIPIPPILPVPPDSNIFVQRYEITQITVTDGGKGYVTPPTVTISNGDETAVAEAVISNGEVTSINVVFGGSYNIFQVLPPPTEFTALVTISPPP
jgi:hypothetical protein